MLKSGFLHYSRDEDIQQDTTADGPFANILHIDKKAEENSGVIVELKPLQDTISRRAFMCIVTRFLQPACRSFNGSGEERADRAEEVKRFKSIRLC